MANTGEPVAILSDLALDEQRPDTPVCDDRIAQAISSIRALAAVLARQAARDDDAKERETTDSGPASPNALEISR